MGVVLMDSFDGYATAQIANKWTYATASVAIQASGGRNGTNGLRLPGNSHYVYEELPSSYNTIYMGFAMKADNITFGGRAFLALYEGSTLHVDFRMADDTGKIYATRNGTTLGTTTNQVIYPNTWAHIQVKVYIHDSAGTIDVLVNGVNVLSLSGIDTKNDGTGVINCVRLSFGPWSASTYFDDVWVSDSELLGDCRIECILPSGSGATTQWDASAGNNYECVDENTPNSDTDYVSTATADEIDTYAFSNLTTTAGTVKGVQVSAFARKDDAGSRSIALVSRPGSTDRVGDTKALADSYNYYSQILDENPDTEAAWTISEVNASEFGVKLVS